MSAPGQSLRHTQLCSAAANLPSELGCCAEDSLEPLSPSSPTHAALPANWSSGLVASNQVRPVDPKRSSHRKPTHEPQWRCDVTAEITLQIPQPIIAIVWSCKRQRLAKNDRRPQVKTAWCVGLHSHWSPDYSLLPVPSRAQCIIILTRRSPRRTQWTESARRSSGRASHAILHHSHMTAAWRSGVSLLTGVRA